MAIFEYKNRMGARQVSSGTPINKRNLGMGFTDVDPENLMLDNMTNAALLRVHARYLRTALKYSVHESDPTVAEDLRWASGRYVAEMLGAGRSGDLIIGGIVPKYVEAVADLQAREAGILTGKVIVANLHRLRKAA